MISDIRLRSLASGWNGMIFNLGGVEQPGERHIHARRDVHDGHSDTFIEAMADQHGAPWPGALSADGEELIARGQGALLYQEGGDGVGDNVGVLAHGCTAGA